MKIHEFQAKQILKKNGVAVPRGDVAFSVDETLKISQKIDKNESCVIKAQIHAGGRGKGGGVRICEGKNMIRQNAQEILGMHLITNQTDAKGQKVKQLLVEESIDIKKELYCSVLVDRAKKSIVLIASTEGGMDIEEVARKNPSKIFKIYAYPGMGLNKYQVNELVFLLKINEINHNLIQPCTEFFLKIFETFIKEDCSLLEINPLVVTKDNQIIALDAKMTFDENATFRQIGHNKLRDLDEEDPLEIEAGGYNLNYIKLNGNIGCMVNGAGLAMGTMDMIKSYGGDPANFLDVGGSASQETVENAFRIITKDKNIKCILINIFGGIVRCDMVASGLIAALKNFKLQIPVIIRLEGTNSKKANLLIENSNLKEKLILADGIGDAAEKAVAAAN